MGRTAYAPTSVSRTLRTTDVHTLVAQFHGDCSKFDTAANQFLLLTSLRITMMIAAIHLVVPLHDGQAERDGSGQLLSNSNALCQDDRDFSLQCGPVKSNPLHVV